MGDRPHDPATHDTAPSEEAPDSAGETPKVPELMASPDPLVTEVERQSRRHWPTVCCERLITMVTCH
jgi:hypothetical protein